jgi:NTP pyrophosphatase (non-canonical NTP hydrolase)
VTRRQSKDASQTGDIYVSIEADITVIDQWIDDSTASEFRDNTVLALYGRTVKVAEECGEVAQAIIGVTGQNPRKGKTHSIDDVKAELADVVVTALCAIQHITKDGQATTNAVIVKQACAVMNADQPEDSNHPTIALFEHAARISAACGQVMVALEGVTRHDPTHTTDDLTDALTGVVIDALRALQNAANGDGAYAIQIVENKLVQIMLRAGIFACPGCIGRGTGNRCFICGGIVPLQLRRTADMPTETDATYAENHADAGACFLRPCPWHYARNPRREIDG